MRGFVGYEFPIAEFCFEIVSQTVFIDPKGTQLARKIEFYYYYIWHQPPGRKNGYCRGHST